jgi:hypothetical protein
MPPPLPYFKVNICPFPLLHFASIFFAYLWSFRWPEHLTIDKKCLRVCFFIATFSRRYWAGNTHEHIWSLRDWPFNLKGLCYFSKKNILIPNVAEKNILILVEEKKIMWFRVFVKYGYMDRNTINKGQRLNDK